MCETIAKALPHDVADGALFRYGALFQRPPQLWRETERQHGGGRPRHDSPSDVWDRTWARTSAANTPPRKACLRRTAPSDQRADCHSEAATPQVTNHTAASRPVTSIAPIEATLTVGPRSGVRAW